MNSWRLKRMRSERMCRTSRCCGFEPRTGSHERPAATATLGAISYGAKLEEMFGRTAFCQARILRALSQDISQWNSRFATTYLSISQAPRGDRTHYPTDVDPASRSRDRVTMLDRRGQLPASSNQEPQTPP